MVMIVGGFIVLVRALSFGEYVTAAILTVSLPVPIYTFVRITRSGELRADE